VYTCGSGDLAFAPTPLAAMFAFSPDRHAVNLHTHATNDGTGRVSRTGVAQPSSQPGSSPVLAPTVPSSVPSEPDHERAYPQADGEP
jgi:hypothetical protein